LARSFLLAALAQERERGVAVREQEALAAVHSASAAAAAAQLQAARAACEEADQKLADSEARSDALRLHLQVRPPSCLGFALV
jgi:hypothetical protein